MGSYSKPIIPKKNIIRKILKAIRIGKRLVPLTPIERSYLEAVSFAGYILENTKYRYKIVHVKGHYRKIKRSYVKPYTRRIHEEYYLDIDKLVHDYGREELIELFRNLLK